MKKYEVIYNTYKESILSGILKYGDRVDSIRECVKKMHVSKTTVETAYNKLVLDGFISSQEKIGYVVSMNSERILLHHEILDYSSNHKEKVYDYDFRIQSVSFDSFETTIWKRYIKDVLNDKKLMSSYGMSQGEYGLRQALCKYVYQNRNILCFPEQMVIGSNYQSLLYIFCGMLDKNKKIGLSTLVDEQAKQVFLSYGFHVEYLRPEHFIEDICDREVDVVYVNTTCFTKDRQSMSERIRKNLMDMKNILILEDDYNGELVYASKIKTSLCSKNKNVIYFSSFSRLLLPSLRIGYMILNEEYTKKYSASFFGPTASKLEQVAFTQYIVDGYLQKHLRKLVREYKEKHLYLKNLLDQYISCPVILDETYMAYWLDLDVDLNRFKSLCEASSIGLSCSNERIGLSFASMDKELMASGVIRLAELLKEC